MLHGLLTGAAQPNADADSRTVWEVIGDVVKRNEIDLLVLASRGRQWIPRLVLGSVAEEVFRNVTSPGLLRWGLT